MWDKPPPFAALSDAIANPSNPIGMRMRAAYFLRQAHADDQTIQEKVVETLAQGLVDERHGSLMRHEFAYVMGQLRDERCCDTLEKVLQKGNDCTMVRHEAAEALGAIGAQRSTPVLETVMNDNPDLPELSDTCRLALNVMKWRADGSDPNDTPAACACMLSPYASVDPAPPNPKYASVSSLELGDILCDSKQSIFERYRAMFTLRNRGGEDAVLQLCRALVSDDSSALLRHEVAYVLGQMQHPASVDALAESLRRKDEHQMVRHESAEALGAIEGRWEEVQAVLEEFARDSNVVVRESCVVALDAADYWGHSAQEKTDDPEGTSPSFSALKAAPGAKPGEDDQKLRQQVANHHFNVK